MPSKRRGGDLVLFSADDPQPLVGWLCDTFGLQTILQAVAQYRPSGGAAAEAPAKRAYKKRGPKKGSKRGGAKKGGAKRGRKAKGTAGGSEVGNH